MVGKVHTPNSKGMFEILFAEWYKAVDCRRTSTVESTSKAFLADDSLRGLVRDDPRTLSARPLAPKHPLASCCTPAYLIGPSREYTIEEGRD
eukprot:4688349-Pyramimonas_sp.AAC.1